MLNVVKSFIEAGGRLAPVVKASTTRPQFRKHRFPENSLRLFFLIISLKNVEKQQVLLTCIIRSLIRTLFGFLEGYEAGRALHKRFIQATWKFHPKKEF